MKSNKPPGRYVSGNAKGSPNRMDLHDGRCSKGQNSNLKQKNGTNKNEDQGSYRNAPSDPNDDVSKQNSLEENVAWKPASNSSCSCEQCSTLEAIQKCMDHALRSYFIHTMEKMECLSAQLLRNECMFAKIHLDLVERISKLYEQKHIPYQPERLSVQESGEMVAYPYEHDEESDEEDDMHEVTPSENFKDGYEMVPAPMTNEEHQYSNFVDENLTLEQYKTCEEKIQHIQQELLSTKQQLEECITKFEQVPEPIPEEKKKKVSNIQNSDDRIKTQNNSPRSSLTQSPKQKDCTERQNRLSNLERLSLPGNEKKNSSSLRNR